MIDSETGLPYDWSNPGGGAASTQPASAPTPMGQGAGQGGGGMSPLLMMLMQQQGGGGLGALMQYFAGGGQGGGAALTQPAYGGIGSAVNPQQPQLVGPNLAQIAQMGQQFGWTPGGGMPQAPPGQQLGISNQLMGGGGPPPDPLTPQQRAFMGYGGQGQPPNWAAAMGMPDPTGGWSPGYQPQTPQQSFTPQDFVSQWQRMFGSK